MDRFYKELEHIFIKFSEYQMKMLLGEFSAKIGREDMNELGTNNKNKNIRYLYRRIN
jgi:hypothetical protein